MFETHTSHTAAGCSTIGSNLREFRNSTKQPVFTHVHIIVNKVFLLDVTMIFLASLLRLPTETLQTAFIRKELFRGRDFAYGVKKTVPFSYAVGDFLVRHGTIIVFTYFYFVGTNTCVLLP